MKAWTFNESSFAANFPAADGSLNTNIGLWSLFQIVWTVSAICFCHARLDHFERSKIFPVFCSRLAGVFSLGRRVD
jgi:hypothetical protein